MMDELKLIIEAIAGLPTIMVWVLLGYLVYKLAIVGSIYGVIRFCVEKIHDAYVNKDKVQTVELRGTIDGVCITTDGTHQALLAQIYRIRNRALQTGSKYIHDGDVAWLATAIDDKIAKDAALKGTK